MPGNNRTSLILLSNWFPVIIINNKLVYLLTYNVTSKFLQFTGNGSVHFGVVHNALTSALAAGSTVMPGTALS
jgi:hypothetical protein